MIGAVLTVLLVPFVSAALVLAFGHRAEGAGRGIAVGGSGLGLAVAVVVAFSQLGDAAPFTHVVASTTGFGPPIELAVHVDPLSAVLLLLAGTVAFLVQV